MASFKSAENVYDSDSEEEVVDVFQPPSGFKALTHVPNEYQPTKDEEVWLIQMPHGIKLDKLNKITNSKAFIVDTEEEPKNYSVKDISDAPDVGKFKLILNDKLYTEKKFSKILKVSESVTIPSIDLHKAVVPKPVVAQKEGLRIRHYATGYGPDQNALELQKKTKTSKDGGDDKAKSAKSDKGKEKEKEKEKSKKRKKDGDEHKKKKKVKKSD